MNFYISFVNLTAVSLLDIQKYIKSQLKDFICNVQVVEDGINITDVASYKQNRIMMRPGDARIAKFGREYLNTYKLNKDQYDLVFSLIDGLSTDIPGETSVYIDEEEYMIDNVLCAYSHPTKFPVK